MGRGQERRVGVWWINHPSGCHSTRLFSHPSPAQRICRHCCFRLAMLLLNQGSMVGSGQWAEVSTLSCETPPPPMRHGGPSSYTLHPIGSGAIYNLCKRMTTYSIPKLPWLTAWTRELRTSWSYIFFAVKCIYPFSFQKVLIWSGSQWAGICPRK